MDMEPQQQSQNPQQLSTNNNNSYLCRQSSSRWTPTSEQIKLLKELYYINGVRSPTADQIQNICARLRRYGKIEGKNVFYWFQNHKARERQKKRLTPTTTPTNLPPHYNQNNNNNIIINGNLTWKQDDLITMHNKYPCVNNPGVSCSSSSAAAVSGGGQFVASFGYGGVTMENKFKDCSISGGGVVNGGNHVNHNFQWAATGGTNKYNSYAPSTYSNFLDNFSAIDEDHDQDHHDHDGVITERETLPLFPMHDEDHHIAPSYYTGGYRCSNGGGGGGGGGASLELSLNSYGYGCYSPNL